MRKHRGTLAFGLIFILLGAWFLAMQFVPELKVWITAEYSWPWIIIGVGVLLAVLGLLTWAPGLLVPACIVGGIGGILYYQNTTGEWATWSFVWTLIPGFVGVGVLLSELMEGRVRKALEGGGWLILISLVLFGIFGTTLGENPLIKQYWPVLLILLGLIMLARAVFRPRKT